MNPIILGIIADRIIAREGGIADVGDGAGVTRFGQTPIWLEQFHLPAPETPAQARENYLTVWTMLKLCNIAPVDDLLADAVLDEAVNASERHAIRSLQSVLGVQADGLWGPLTDHALDKCDRLEVAAKFLAAEVAHDGSMITADPAKAKFAHGWANRRAAQIVRLGTRAA